MKKTWILPLIIVFGFSIFSGVFLSGQNISAPNHEKFIDFLVKNKETLKYESFGTFEHEDLIEVRVYCSEESGKKIGESISKFDCKEYRYKSKDHSTGTLFVLFSKNGSYKNSVVKKITKKKKCPRKVFVEFKQIKKVPFNDYKYFEKGIYDGGKSEIISTVAGKVAKVFLNSGDRVEEGDILINFDLLKYNDQIKETETLLAGWRIKLKKRKQWKVRSARAELQAEKKIKEIELKLEEFKALKKESVFASDKTGQIVDVVKSGSVLSVGDTVATVLDNSVMKMSFSGDDAALISKLDRLSVKFDGVDNVRIGKVKNVNGKVVVSFDNSDLKLSSKSVGKFKVLLKTYESEVVLNKSLVNRDSFGDYVYCVKKKRAVKVVVRTGPEEDGKVVILSGLNEGDKVITTKDDCLRNGKRIKFKVSAPAKKKEKKVIKREKPVRKIVKREEKPVVSNTVRFMEKKGWSDFENCPSSVKVKTRIVKRGVFSGYETFNSVIVSGTVETVDSEIDGLISKSNASVGSEVSSGQLLIAYDVEDIKKRLENARSSLNEWKKLLSDIEGWKERSESLENELKEKIRVRSLLIPKLSGMISNPNIYSPVDGTVVSIVRSGDSVKKGNNILKIKDDSKVYIPINTADISNYGRDLKVRTAFKGVSGEFDGKLKISGERVYVVVDNYSKNLKVGMKAKVNILREYPNVIVVNKSEILRDSNGYYSYIVKNRRAKKVPLVIGADKGSKIIVLSGLKDGDEQIITNFDCLDDGKKIRVLYYDSTLGKYVIRRTEKEKVALLNRIFSKKMAAGIGFGYYSVTDKLFTGLYGSGIISGVVDLSVNVLNRVELFANVWYIPKSGSSKSISEVNLTMFSFYIGGKFIFGGNNSKVLPYVGAALNSLAVKEKSEELELDTSFRTSVGFSGIGGLYYKFKENINLKFDIRYDFNKMKIEELDSELDFSGIKIALGVVFRF